MNDTAYLVLITSFNPKRKVGGIKQIRTVTGLGVAKAKSLIDNCPSEIMNGMHLSQAEELSELLRKVGMTVEIIKDEANIPVLKNLSQINFDLNENHNESKYFQESSNFDFEELLQFALVNANSFSLVWQDFEFDDSAFELENRLKPWLISESWTSSWPGTITLAGNVRANRKRGPYVL